MFFNSNFRDPRIKTSEQILRGITLPSDPDELAELR
jgi:hypothetical protein